jgi:integrase
MRGERGTARPYRRGKTWWVQYFSNGKRVRESAYTNNKSIAIKLLNQRKAQSDTRQLIATEATVSDLLDHLLSDYRRHSRASIKAVESYVENHVRPGLGRVKAADVTSQQISSYIEQRQREKAASASINRELEMLRRAFRLAHEATPPLIYSIPKIALLDTTNAVRTGFVEHTQYAALRGALPPHLRLLWVIGYHLGLRRGEILSLNWSQVDWEAGILRLEGRQTKSRHPRTAPLYGDLRSELKRAWERRGDCPFLIQYEGHGVTEIKRAWNTARKAVKLPDVLVHDLRRTAVRNMIRAGVSQKVCMEISGHRTTHVFQRYDITDERDIVDAGKKLAAYLKKQSRPLRHAAKLKSSHKVATTKRALKSVSV